MCAWLATCYPLALLASLYGQWLLSWALLGHRPRPSLDDPKSIDGALPLRLLTEILMLGFLPMLPVAGVLQVFTPIWHQSGWPRYAGGVAAVLLAWVGTVLWLLADPGRVLYWWFD